jgi:predicted RND superfamily exporter protein/outer membrane lipoprotein-sorting protein
MKFRQFTDITRFLLKNAKRFSVLVILAFVGLGAVSALSLSKLKTEYSMRQFLPAHHKLMETDDKMKARFQLPDLEPFFALISIPENDSGIWLEPARIAKLKEVTTSLARVEGVDRAVSLATIDGASSSAEGITVGQLLELTPPKNWSARVLGDPILTPALITTDARTVVLAIVNHVGITQAASSAVQEAVRAQVKSAFPGYQLRLGGIPVVQTEMSHVLGKELKNFLALSLLASLLTLMLFFRSFSSVFVPLILMVLANVISLAWMAWTGTAFTVLSSTLPVLVALTVVSMSAHTMLRYASDWQLALRSQENPNPIRVLFHSYSGLLLPNFLTAVTTSIGFFAIAFANIPLVRQYGITVGISIFVCWFVVIGALLPLLVLFPVPQVRNWTEKRASWALWVTKHNRKVVAAVAVLCAACLFYGQNLNWSAQLFDDLPKGYEARSTTEFVDSNLGGMIPLDIVVEKDEENAWNDPSAIAKLDSLAGEWRKDPAVGSVTGPQDFIRVAGKVQGRGLASTRQEAAEYAFLYGFAAENPYKQYVTGDGRAARINLRLHDIPGDKMALLVQRLADETRAKFPGWTVTTGAMATTVHVLNNELCRELIFGFWQALLLIAVILCCIFRSVRWTIAAVIPNLVPVFLLLGALYIGATPIKPGIALIFSIALGISFDNTVYLLGRLRLLRDRSEDKRILVAKAWYQEGNLCLFSSLALSSGFFVFLASFFSLNQQFGMYMLIAILGSLVGDLVLMPAMLAAFPGMLENKRKPEPQKENKMSERAIAAGLALAFFTSSFASAAVNLKDAKSILKNVEKNMSATDEVANIKMTITEADGSKRARGLQISRKGKDSDQKVMVRLNAPADLKGTGLLSVSKGSSSDQWLYMPSNKQTRRIQSGNRSGGFMESEMSYEDMGTNADAKFESKLLPDETIAGRKYSVIENTPKGDSSYGKIRLFVDQGTFLVGKMEYFDKAMKPLKTTNFSGYKQFDKGIWRAQKVEVANLQTKRGTTLELSDLKLNKGLDDAEFTESALTEGD